MPSTALTDTIGAIDPAALAKEYPHLATKLALDTAKAAGVDTKNPRNVVTAMYSGGFQTSLKESTAEKRDDRALSRIMRGNLGPNPTFDPKADPVQAETQGFQSAADSIRRTSTGRGILFDKVMDETERLGALADFNETAYKKKRMLEMRPTDDIDKQIMDLRNRALFSKAAMFDNLGKRNIPYGAQARAVAAMQKVFIDQMNDLQGLRKARIDDFDSKIQEEMDAHHGRVAASEARLSGLDKAIQILKDQGADEQAIAQLTIDHSKEMERLRKARASGSKTGMTDTIDVIAQALTQKYVEEHAGQIPDDNARTEIKRQAEFIVKNRGDLTTKVLGAGGTFDALKQPAQDVQEEVPRNWFLRMLPDALVSPTTTRSRTIPASDPFEDSGFGVPYSAADEAELKRKRDLAGYKE